MDDLKLETARSNIDRLNSEIVSLLIERMNNVDKVAGVEVRGSPDTAYALYGTLLYI